MVAGEKIGDSSSYCLDQPMRDRTPFAGLLESQSPHSRGRLCGFELYGDSMEMPPNRKLTAELTELAGTAALGAVPLLGGPLGAGFAYAMSLPFNRRQQRWFEAIAQALTNVEEQLAGLTLEQLAADDGFVDTFIAATRAAASTNHQVKLDALRNTVVNAADIGARPDEELRLRMIRLVDEMVPLHMLLLTMLDAPKEWFSQHKDLVAPKFSMGGYRMQIVDAAFPELAKDKAQRDRLIEDLVVWRLAGMASNAMMSGDGVWDPSSTPMGKEFLAYIRNDTTTKKPQN